MLSITGPLNGKVYNDEVVTPEEFAKLFGAPGKKTGDGIHILELCPHMVKVDAFGQESYPRGIQQNCSFTIQNDGDVVNVRYYTNKTPIPGSTAFNYSPQRLEFSGKANSFMAKDYEQFLFFYVSPICENSPSQQKEAMIRYHDPAAIERAAEAKMARFADLLNQIQTAPDSVVIAKSRGIVVAGRGTSLSETAGVAMHRAALSQLLSYNQDAFDAEWNNDQVFIRGLVREAVLKNVVRQSVSGTKTAWVWSSNDQVITFIAPNADPLTELVAWAVSSDNTGYAREALTLAITGQPQRVHETHPSTPPPAPQGEVSKVRELLNAGVEKGVVWREETSNLMFYQGQQGPVEMRAFSGEDWVGDIEKFLRIPGKQNHLAAITAAVNN